MNTPEPAAATVIRLCPGGPLLVGGDFEVRDEAGRLLDPGKATMALCRCGQSEYGLRIEQRPFIPAGEYLTTLNLSKRAGTPGRWPDSTDGHSYGTS